MILVTDRQFPAAQRHSGDDDSDSEACNEGDVGVEHVVVIRSRTLQSSIILGEKSM